MRGEPIDPEGPLVEPLTRREQEVLRLLAQGRSRPEIAEQLTVTLSAVKFHTQNIYGKLGVNSKRQAVARAGELGLLGDASPTVAPVMGRLVFQPEAAPENSRHNLPLQVTRFFGRETEIAQLKAHVDEQRLVTLTGPGGVGKTRLSLAVAEELVDEYADGVWLVELAPLTQPALVVQQTATILGVRDDGGQSLLAALSVHLRDRQVLLLLDNCEHLLEACGELADALLRADPRLKILASSREPLGVPGEAVFPVPQLSFPDPGQPVTADGLSEYAAVRLLLDRARLVLPDYRPAAAEAASLAYIVQRLDGIPLAIEMAAARLSVLSAEQLAGRLDDAFRVLTGGSRTALPRQQTLRATLDWSYELLSEPERLLLQRLSIFAGGCTLEAAEAVCAGEALAAGEVLERMAALAAKSMVIVVHPPGQPVRYQMLETVRQYAREKLNDAGESAELRVRHRDYFLGQIEAFRQVPWPGSEREWTAWVRVEVDNVRLGLEWSLSDEANIEAAPRLALGALDAWPTFRESVDWANKVLAWCDAHPQLPGELRVHVLGHLTDPLAQNNPDLVTEWLRQAVAIGRELGPAQKHVLGDALWALIDDTTQSDNAGSALPLVAEAEALLHEMEADPTQRVRVTAIAWAHLASARAEIAFRQGLYLESITYTSEAIQIYQTGGYAHYGEEELVTRAKSRLHLGEYGLAREDLLKAASLVRYRVGYSGANRAAYITRCLAETDWLLGNQALARQENLASLRMANEVPEYNIVASNLALAASMAAKRSQTVRAATLAGAAQAMYMRQHHKPWEDSSMDTLLPGWRDGPERAALSEAFEEGQAMSADQAIALALDEQPDPKSL